MNKENGGKGKKTVLIPAIVLIIAAIAAVSYGYVKREGRDIDSEKNSQTDRVVQTEDGEKYKLGEDEYSIKVKEKDGSKVVDNEEAGVSLVVPEDWDPDFVYDVNNELKLKISKAGPNQPDAPTDIVDGAILEVYEYNNSANLDLEGWMKNRGMNDYKSVKFQNFLSAKREGAMLKEADYSFDLIPRENSYFFSYYFATNNKIIELSCSSFGVDCKRYIEGCEDIFAKGFSVK